MSRTADRGLVISIVLVGALAWLPLCGRSATLEADVAEATEGYYQLRWEADEPVRLVEARDVDFADARTIYAGDDSASVVSGKPDGTWHYRLEAASGSRVLSEPITVRVSHHTLERAATFFALGAIVFVATVVLVTLGARGDGTRGSP